MFAPSVVSMRRFLSRHAVPQARHYTAVEGLSIGKTAENHLETPRKGREKRRFRPALRDSLCNHRGRDPWLQKEGTALSLDAGGGGRRRERKEEGQSHGERPKDVRLSAEAGDTRLEGNHGQQQRSRQRRFPPCEEDATR